MQSNPATLWAETLINELYRAGLRHVCISPGSRSTPLTFAATAHPHLRHTLHLDERSAAFFALGIALETGQPAALICTSGTAAANYFPTIIEASQSEVPMLVLTSDRPHELRHSGANQTMDQVKLYGDHVRWSVDAPLPEADPFERTLRYLRALADRALAVSLGQNGLPGPVHINLPFRKPLEPSSSALHLPDALHYESSEQTSIHITPRTPQSNLLADIAKRVQSNPKGVIVAGPRCPKGDFAFALSKLSAQTGYPILADPLSGLRFGEHVNTGTVIAGYGAALRTQKLANVKPDLILRFGVMPISQPLSDFLENQPADVSQIGVSEHGFWSDPAYRLTELYVADPLLFVKDLNELLIEKIESSEWAQRWLDTEKQAFDAFSAAPLFEGKIVVDALHDLPADTRLVVANSLPIRHVEEWMPASEKPLHVFANRGVSGIDGTISTALGIASQTSSPTLVVTGDLSFFHDQNGLQALQNGNFKITVLLVNNNGGGIFHRLPVAQHEPPFEEMFITPHKMDFSNIAKLYGLNYELIDAENAAEKVAEALISSQSYLLEIRTDSAHGEKIRREILQKLKD